MLMCPVLLGMNVRPAGVWPAELPDVPVTETFRVATVTDTFYKSSPFTGAVSFFERKTLRFRRALLFSDTASFLRTASVKNRLLYKVSASGIFSSATFLKQAFAVAILPFPPDGI